MTLTSARLRWLVLVVMVLALLAVALVTMHSGVFSVHHVVAASPNVLSGWH